MSNLAKVYNHWYRILGIDNGKTKARSQDDRAIRSKSTLKHASPLATRSCPSKNQKQIYNQTSSKPSTVSWEFKLSPWRAHASLLDLVHNIITSITTRSISQIFPGTVHNLTYPVRSKILPSEYFTLLCGIYHSGQAWSWYTGGMPPASDQDVVWCPENQEQRSSKSP